MRPGSAMRVGTAAGFGGAGLARPGTGVRLATAGRIGTGAGAGFAGAVGPLTDVAIADRPVTQQGLGGMRMSTAGPGRMVQDASFFASVLRQRINEISGEITRMRGEVDKSAKDATVLNQYEKKYESLIKEVRALEGDLADYNLAMDKSRTSMDASEIVSFYSTLRRRNEATAREVDALFMERQERERGAHRLEEQIAELQRASEARINSLSKPLQAEFKALGEENSALNAEIGTLQAQLEHVNAQVEAAENAMKRDRVRDEYALLDKRLAHMKREKGALEEEMASTRLDPGDARERLLAKVKQDNARIQEIDKHLREVEEQNAARKRAIGELTGDIEERRGEAGDSAKYELLFRRDQEMTEFIDRFEELKRKELGEHSKTQNTIVALSEHISEGMDREKSMPTKEQAEEMKEEYTDKNKELKASQMTQERLQEELQRRQTDLEKIDTLDARIGQELITLADTMLTMRKEMVSYADIGGLKAKAASVKVQLELKIKDYSKRRDMLRQQVTLLSADYERRKGALARDTHAAALEALETKLKNQEQAVFGLKEFIATKGRESDYDGVKKDASRMCTELNILIQKAQLVIPANAAAGGGYGFGR